MKVLLIGPDPNMKGGVSHGIRLMLKYPPPEVEYEIVPTISPAVEAASFRGRSKRYFSQGILSLQFFLRSLARMSRVLKETQPDLAHVRFSSYGSSFRKGIVARRLQRHGTPFVLSAHGAAYRQFFARLPRVGKQWVRTMFLLSRGLIALSESWRTYYVSIIGDSSVPVWVLPNAVELPQERVDWSVEEPPRILFLGRMGERKGSARLLQAVAMLPPPVRAQVSLYMAGDGAVDSTRELAHTLGLEQQTVISDWIQGDQKVEWFRLTNIFALPSRDEGLPNAMLEAMAWGKALIVSPAGAIPEFVSDGVEGFIVPSDDLQAISNAIQRLVEDPNLRVRMGQAARARVEPLDIQHYRVRLGNIYREALNSTPALQG